MTLSTSRNIVCLLKWNALHCFQDTPCIYETKAFFKCTTKTRRFSNHESRLLSRSHTFAINGILYRFENTSKYVDTVTLFSKLEPKVIDPKMTFDPKSVEVTCVILPKDHCVQVPRKYIKVYMWIQ